MFIFIWIEISIYLQFIINYLSQLQMRRQDFVGISKSCQAKCFALNKQAYSQLPHTGGQHEIYTSKQFVKKISNITMVGQLIYEHVEQINKLVEQIKNSVEKIGNQAITGLKKNMFQSMLNEKQVLSDRIYDSFCTLSKLQYEQLSCLELNEVLSCMKNIKMANIQQIAEEYVNKVSKRLKSILQFGLSLQLRLIQPIKSKVSTQASEKNRLMQEEDLDSIDNYFAHNESSTIGDISLDFQQNQQSIIDKLYEESENGFKKDKQKKKQKLPDEEFFTGKKSERQQKNIEIIEKKSESGSKIKSNERKSESELKNNEKKSVLLDFDNDSMEEQEEFEEKKEKKEKKQIFYKKVDQIPEEKNEKQKNAVPIPDKKEEIDPTKSYVNKQQGRYYIKVCHLQKQVEKTDRSKFNIELKVVQKVMYRLFQDKNSKKIYQKVKFIAGDENGIVVCYTNHVKSLKRGSYVVLKDCSLDQFKEKSYQISSNQCSLITQKRSFNAQQKKSISRFSSLNPLIYSIQKQQSTWPSVLGIAYLDRKRYKKIQLIVQIDQVIDDSGDTIECFLSDGTGQIFARINREALPQELKQNNLTGSVIFLKKLQAYEEKQGSQDFIYLKVLKQNCPMLMKEMQYNDGIQIKNVNQIYKDLSTQ